MKPKKASSKYEVKYEAFVFKRKNETYIEILSQSVKRSSKYEPNTTGKIELLVGHNSFRQLEGKPTESRS
jgi:hypothetical protein